MRLTAEVYGREVVPENLLNGEVVPTNTVVLLKSAGLAILNFVQNL